MISIVIISVLCPIIGKLIYNMSNKQSLLFYGLISLVITGLLFLLTDHPSWNDVKQIIIEYWNGLQNLKFSYISILITYILSGVGLLGGTLEFAGEKIETEDTYKELKVLSRIKLYLLHMIYGYIFLFAIFAFSQFLMEFLQWEYKGAASFIRNWSNLLLFRGLWLPIIGSIFFTIKSFRYGLFSTEFYRSEFHPSVAEISWQRREFRRLIACILGPLMIYLNAFAYILEQYPPLADQSLTLGKALFFLAVSIEAIIFYLFKERFVDQLKPISDQYSIKVGTGKLLNEDEQEASYENRDVNMDLRFED